MELATAYRDLSGTEPYRASLHNHTFKDGVPTAAPWVALGIYRQCEIDIVAITEHDERLHPNRDITGEAAWEDAADVNVPWEDCHYQNPYDDALLVTGYEATFPDTHVNVLGVDYLDVAEDPCTLYGTVEGEPGEEGYVAGMQERGAFTVINHPADYNDDPDHVLEDENFSRCDGIELYNGYRCFDAERVDATPLWDACLSRGERFWGLANSDTHRYDFTTTNRPTNGYNVVYLPELSEPALFEALRAGRFYASSGLEVDEIAVGGDEIRVRAADAVRIRFVGEGGRVLSEVTGQEASYEPDGTEGYVRVELESDEKPHPDSAVPKQAWLQPVFIGE